MARRAIPKLAALALAALLLTGLRLSGQTYPQVAPKPVREGLPAPAKPPRPLELPATESNEVLVPHLAGLRLIPAAGRLSATALPAGPAVAIEDLPWLDRRQVGAIAQDYLDRPLTRGDLARLVRALVLLSRQSDRPVVDIFAPPQDVSTGVVQLVVLVARLGQVRAEGNRWFPSDVLTRQIRLAPGQEIAGQSLLEDLNALNQNPFRQVDLVYARGAAPGQTDILLRTNDERPERVYGGYDDTGNAATGLGRWFAGFNLGDLWNDDHQFSYQYTGSTDLERLQAHSASYLAPLPWRDTFEFFGDWAKSSTSSGQLIELTGHTWQLGARYTVPLPILGNAITQSVNAGINYKWDNNNLGFGGTQIFASPVNQVEGVAGYTVQATDNAGSTSGAFTGVYSPGGLGGLNHVRNFAAQRPGAPTQYEYVDLSLTRLQRLPADFTASLALQGQWSAQRLLPSDQFGLGGANSVRGYDERIVNGDDGLSAQLELRSPESHILGAIPDRTQALVFVDAGRDWEHDAIAGETDITLASAGPGLRVSLGKYGSLKVDYGWQLKRLIGTRSGRFHVSAMIMY
jgi:hemolysin activation/secretion protein